MLGNSTKGTVLFVEFSNSNPSIIVEKCIQSKYIKLRRLAGSALPKDKRNIRIEVVFL